MKYIMCKTHVFEIVELIEKSLPFNVTHQYVEGTPGDQMGVYGDNSKIIRDLDWTPKISFEEGMTKMVAWALQI
ncbi:GDP-mannose 4,6-dehydratase [Bacteroides caecimuris]|uniref:GDP-mannose 4,6-dehydratase n=1 Tax=Bacteroides caecimuris TaxID=1796613 RepID=UPI0020CC7473|nr:GDP-mannose 4,6-dehydratase [Bacteroides caecimuris]